MFSLSNKDLISSEFRIDCMHNSAGAFVCFEGWVRDHNEGKSVEHLEYTAFTELAMSEGEVIMQEAITKFKLRAAKCVHRIGDLPIGGIAVLVGVSTDHRGEAFKACEYIIDEIKSRVPIWKKEFYVNEKALWVACHNCSHKGHL